MTEYKHKTQDDIDEQEKSLSDLIYQTYQIRKDIRGKNEF